MNWLKEKYKELVLNAFLSLLTMLFVLWITGIKDSDANIKRDIEFLKINKAHIEYVDKQNEIQNVRTETIRTETRSDLKEINDKLDQILIRMTK